MSEITERIQKVHDAGGEGWPELRDWLIAHRYVTPQRYDNPNTTQHDEADWDNVEVDGSWDEVIWARARKLISDDQFYEVVRGINAARR